MNQNEYTLACLVHARDGSQWLIISSINSGLVRRIISSARQVIQLNSSFIPKIFENWAKSQFDVQLTPYNSRSSGNRSLQNTWIGYVQLSVQIYVFQLLNSSKLLFQIASEWCSLYLITESIWNFGNLYFIYCFDVLISIVSLEWSLDKLQGNKIDFWKILWS